MLKTFKIINEVNDIPQDFRKVFFPEFTWTVSQLIKGCAELAEVELWPCEQFILRISVNGEYGGGWFTWGRNGLLQAQADTDLANELAGIIESEYSKHPRLHDYHERMHTRFIPQFEHSGSLGLGDWRFIWPLPDIGSTLEAGYLYTETSILGVSVYPVEFSNGVSTDSPLNRNLRDGRPDLFDKLCGAMQAREQWIELSLATRKTIEKAATPPAGETENRKRKARRWASQGVDPASWEFIGEIEYDDENSAGEAMKWRVYLSLKPNGNWPTLRMVSQAPALYKGSYTASFSKVHSRLSRNPDTIKLEEFRPGLYAKLTDFLTEYCKNAENS